MGLRDVAIKILKDDRSESCRVKLLQEAAIMGQFRHPNIVQIYGVVTMGEPVMIILDYMHNGDLRKFMQSLKPNPGSPVNQELPQLCLTFCQQVESGMEYLAGKKFIHKYLVAQYILVSESRVCKISDFSKACNLEEGSSIVPTKWTAPEALHYKKYSTARMCGVLAASCMRYGVWGSSHSRDMPPHRL